MDSSAVPAVPWASRVGSPLIAAARGSLTQLLAVPGSPNNNSARAGGGGAAPVFIRRFWPTYLGVITAPPASLPPIRYVSTAHGDSRQLVGFCFVSSFASAASSSANCCSAGERRTADFESVMGSAPVASPPGRRRY